MLTALYESLEEGDLDEYRRQAMNYRIVVGSFVAGAISSHPHAFIHQWAIWLITVNLFLIMTTLHRQSQTTRPASRQSL